MAPTTPHLLLLPFPAQGHINPMLHLASHLLLADCSITFVTTERCHSSMLAAQSPPTSPLHPLIRFLTIPDGFPPTPSFKLDMSKAALRQVLHGVQQQQGLLEDLIERSRSTASPISCVISDFFFPWMLDVANKFGIPKALLWSSNAAVFSLGVLAKEGKVHPEALEVDDVVSRLGIDKEIFLAIFYLREHEETKEHLMMFQRLEEWSHILVNSFYELEAPYLLHEAPGNLKYIGPCLPPEFYTSEPKADVGLQANLLKEDVECLRWLDEQEENSVLFISFGSVAFFPPTQVEEIAMGIEASKQKFLWVARPDTRANSAFPEGFEERTRGRGMIISWAPQLRVLEHKAVGAFLTHCGWNSTLESIFMGVPMLCFPIFAEQPVNAQLVVNTWQVGMGFRKREDGVVEKGEVERVVRNMMEGEEGHIIRGRSLHLKDLAQNAMKTGGPSHQALTSFVQDIQALATTLT